MERRKSLGAHTMGKKRYEKKKGPAKTVEGVRPPMSHGGYSCGRVAAGRHKMKRRGGD